MKKLFSFIIICALSLYTVAQDIDFYLKEKNDNYKLPSIPKDMTFEEFYLLSQTFRMQDVLFATVVPGYIHFKAQENNTAYILIGLRTISTATLTYEYYKVKKHTLNVNIQQFLFSSGQNQIISNADKYLITSALITSTLTYLFDIIHGKYILEKKQEYVRFKYSPRISFSFNSLPTTSGWIIAIRLNL